MRMKGYQRDIPTYLMVYFVCTFHNFMDINRNCIC